MKTLTLYSLNTAQMNLRVSLRHDPAVGDLHLDINTTEVGNALLASSDGPHGLEVIELGPTGVIALCDSPSADDRGITSPTR